MIWYIYDMIWLIWYDMIHDMTCNDICYGIKRYIMIYVLHDIWYIWNDTWYVIRYVYDMLWYIMYVMWYVILWYDMFYMTWHVIWYKIWYNMFYITWHDMIYDMPNTIANTNTLLAVPPKSNTDELHSCLSWNLLLWVQGVAWLIRDRKSSLRSARP